MRAALSHIGAGTRALSYLLGFVVIGLAFAVYATSADLNDISQWLEGVFGPVFLVMLGGLVFLALLALMKLANMTAGTQSEEGAKEGARAWYETGMQAASGIATLALTYTLLGISLGIGGLADQVLTPDTVQGVIRDLTANFSTAFMTTVVGLPLSAVLRAVLAVTYTRRLEAAAS